LSPMIADIAFFITLLLPELRISVTVTRGSTFETQITPGPIGLQTMEKFAS